MDMELAAGEPAQVPAPSGQWKPGQSGNPAGRPKGSKNHLVTLQRNLEIAVREHIKPERIAKILDKLCEMAEGGNVKAAKLILDKTIANASSGEEMADDHSRRVEFRIVNATFAVTATSKTDGSQPRHGEIVDAEFTAEPAVLDSGVHSEA